MVPVANKEINLLCPLFRIFRQYVQVRAVASCGASSQGAKVFCVHRGEYEGEKGGSDAVAVASPIPDW